MISTVSLRSNSRDRKLRDTVTTPNPNLKRIHTYWSNICRWSPIMLQSNYFTSSLGMRYRNVKLCGIHSMLFPDFARWHFLILFLRDSGRDCWIISVRLACDKPDSFENESTIFGRSIFWSLLTPNVALMYSSFATSSSRCTLFGVYTRTCHKIEKTVF